MARLFGTDGIRGEANRHPMDAATALAVGQAAALVLKKSDQPPRVIIGKDTRLSGHMLESALDSGVSSMGGVTYLAGVLPTPGIALLARSMGIDGGVMVSASHNPYQDNGIKIFSGTGFKLSDEQEEAIERLVLTGDLSTMVSSPQEIGRACRLDDAARRYITFLKSTFPRSLSLEGLKVVLDTANGAAHEVAPAAFAELGADVMVIHNTPNGLNINENCGSQHTDDLRKAVVEGGAQVGLAFDGDGDRLIAVDELGNEMRGDQIVLVCALMLKQEGRLKNDTVVSTVMSNMGFSVACKKYGLINHAARVGDRHVLEDMLRLGAVIGGEESGHVIFLDHQTTGDGILTGLQLLAAMLKAGKPMSEMAKLMEVLPQKLINVAVKSKPDIQDVPQIVEAIEQVEAKLKGEGRVLVRYSGTENVCRVMVEGPSKDITEKYAYQLADMVKAVIG